MTHERLARWTGVLTAPCPDPRQHPAFDAIRAEIAKLESPTGGQTDWAEVLRVGDAFLAETGRDLLVASAVASALAHREGAAGVTLGTQLLTRLLADTTTTPARARARANALQAFATRAEMGLDASKDRSRASLEPLALALRELAVVAKDTLAGDAPSLRPLEDRVRAALEAVPAPTPVAPAAVFAPPPPSVATPSSESLPDRAEQVPAFVRRVSGQLVAAAALVRASSPLDADALRLTLAALYLPIALAPETTRDARTALPAPPKLVLETLAKQSSAPPESLVRDALAALERNRFALDLHVILARGLERAGSTATRAREVHRHEVRGLLARLPELLDREFSDGTPFASTETRAFFAPPGEVAETPHVASDDPLGELRALARQGRTADALALGTKVRQQAASGRARFDATLAMATLAEDARALPLAAELHAALLGDLDRHALDAWDPALVTGVLRAAVRLAAPGSEAARTAFARLARIDARAAFEVSASLHATPSKTVR